MSCNNCGRQVGARVVGNQRWIKCGLDDVEHESSFHCAAHINKVRTVPRPRHPWERG